MRKVMTTKELEAECVKRFEKAGIEFDSRYVKFSDERKRIPGVRYIFAKRNMYHVIVKGRKGEAIRKIKTDDFDDVFCEVLESGMLNKVVWEYVDQNKRPGMDHRRLSYIKVLEIYASFGEKFRERKLAALKEHLSEEPYNHLYAMQLGTALDDWGRERDWTYVNVYQVFSELGAELCENGTQKTFNLKLQHETVSLTFNDEHANRATEAFFGDGIKMRLVYYGEKAYISADDLKLYLIRVWNRLDENIGLCSPESIKKKPEPPKVRRSPMKYIMAFILLVNLYRVLSVIFFARPFDFDFYIATAPYFVVIPVACSMGYILLQSGYLIAELIFRENNYIILRKLKSILICAGFVVLLMGSAIVDIR